MFSLIVGAACPNVPDNKISTMFLDSNQKLHTSQVLSMDIILSRGLELGSYAPDCWKHIFRWSLFMIIKLIFKSKIITK